MIVSCGEALVDMVPHAVIGGGPLNVAVAAARLGAPAAFVGGISNDEYGQAIWAHLEANKVNLAASARFDAPTAKAIIEHVPELRFRFEGEKTADTQLESIDLDVLGEGPHIIHGGTLGLFRGATARAQADLVERHDGLVSLDPNIRPQIISDRDEWNHFHDRWLARTHIYKGSDEDLEWIFPGRSFDSIAEQLLANGVGAVVLTRGSAGLSILTRDGAATASAPTVEVVDTVGAGDTIIATILSSLWEAGVTSVEQLHTTSVSEWETFANRAVVAAGITVSRAGADVPTRAEIPGW